MTEKKRADGGKWRPHIAREAVRELLPTDYAEATSNNAHLDDAEMADSDPAATATVATLATGERGEPENIAAQATHGFSPLPHLRHPLLRSLQLRPRPG
jgi:hypothetical protein